MPIKNAKSNTETEETADVDEIPPHGAINEEEVERYRERLEKMMDDLRKSAMEQNIREIMGDFVVASHWHLKHAVRKYTPS